MQDKKILPRKVTGFWELEPEQELVFENIIQKIKNVFLRHAFLPLDTPVMEYSEILLAKSGGEIDKQIYRFEKGSTDACLRYDFTVPLARYVAMKEGELTFPFKRFQIGKVYRGERPQKGRYREFYQCDADIIGNENLSLVADAECISLYEDIFNELNLDCQVEISNRKILYGVIESIGEANRFQEISTILDKYEKIGEEETLKLLFELNLDNKKCKILLDFIKIKGNFDEINKNLLKLSKNQTLVEGIEELKEVDQHLKNLSVNNYIFNMNIIRGHNYYTGCVFEVFLKDHHNMGAVGGGGRYDNLANYFSSKKLPGVGMSIGLSRLFDILQQTDLINKQNYQNNTVAIIPLGDTLPQCLSLSSKLRKDGISCEVLFNDKSFKSKLKDANKKGVQTVIIVGENELKALKYSVKNMLTGEQNLLTYEEIINLRR